MYTVKINDVQEIPRLNATVRLAISRNTFPGLEEASQGLLTLDAGKTMDDHLHENSIELFFPIQGKAILMVDNVEYPMEPGVVACVPKGVSHYFINKSGEVFKTVFTHVPHL
jgi:oxalate decarboxylase/phosphoglucose isomerase-like protein (cupin superfamily)